MNGYYSVFDPDGKKIADCGAERDALFSFTVETEPGMDITIRSFLSLETSLMSLLPNNFQLKTLLSTWMAALVAVGKKFPTLKWADKNYKYNNQI